MVVIVLLNVLIAIVSDSYEKCLIRSQNLFGRARVVLLAELSSFQNLFRTSTGVDVEESSPLYQQWWSGELSARGWRRGSVVFLTSSISIFVLWVLGELTGIFFAGRFGALRFSLLDIIAKFAVLVCIYTVLVNGASIKTPNEESLKGNSGGYTSWHAETVQRVMLRLLGTSETNSFAPNEVDEWKGRVHHLQREMTKIANETAATTKQLLRAVEDRVVESEERILRQVSGLENRILDKYTN
mmetsp:Transcript_8811/g.13650  ORF Transcript_8811/g.13650 Transcript_8811/m.13650 type:complete len:242 (-) Transcript_8811:25-750(-)